MFQSVLSALRRDHFGWWRRTTSKRSTRLSRSGSLFFISRKSQKIGPIPLHFLETRSKRLTMAGHSTNNTQQLYLIFDERMALHSPPQPVDDPNDPNFVHERPSRIYAVYSAIQRLERRLQPPTLENTPSTQGSIKRATVKTTKVAKEDGAPSEPRILHLECHPASRETICLVHSEKHYRNLQYTSSLSNRALRNYACTAADQDLYYSKDTFLAATLAAGGCVDCVNAVTNPNASSRRALALVRPPGHHATFDRAMGT